MPPLKLSVPKTAAAATTTPATPSSGGLKLKFKFNRNADKDSPCKITVEAPLLLKKNNNATPVKNDVVVKTEKEDSPTAPRVPPLHINLSQIGKSCGLSTVQEIFLN